MNLLFQCQIPLDHQKDLNMLIFPELIPNIPYSNSLFFQILEVFFCIKICSQTIVSIISKSNQLFIGIKLYNWDYWAKVFFAKNLHFSIYICQNSWFKNKVPTLLRFPPITIFPPFYCIIYMMNYL